MQSAPVGLSRLAALEADIADTRKRLAAAKLSRDTLYKQYLEYRSTIDALVFELERLEKSRASVEAADATDARELMAELGITFEGSQYRCGSRGYERLDDAVNYARLLLGLPALERKTAGA